MHNFIWEGEIDLDICDKLVEFYETCTYLTKRQYESNPFNDAKGNGKDSLDLHCHTMLAKNEKCLNDYLQALIQCVDKYYRTYPQAGQIECHVSPLFNIQKYKPGGGYPAEHSEIMSYSTSHRIMAFMTYLTDTKNGGTEFTYLNWTAPCKKGLTLIWPVDYLYTHTGVISNSDDKMIITGWLGFKDE